MGRMLKNPKQERFVKEYIRSTLNGGFGVEAYRKVFPNSKGFNCASAGTCKLLAKPHIKRRIREMRMDIKRKADITFEKILSNYEEALQIARVKGDPGNITAAATAQAKLVGLLIDRKEVGAAGDFENMESISDILEAVAKQAGPEAALALSKVFGLIGPENMVAIEVRKAPASEEAEALSDAEPASKAVN